MERFTSLITWFFTQPWTIPTILATILVGAVVWVVVGYFRNSEIRQFLSIKGLTDEFINQNQHIFEDLQGNILKPHGRDHVALLFVHFTDVNAAKTSLLTVPITSFWKQLKQTKKYRNIKSQDPSHLGKLFCNLFLSGAGYRRLGAADHQIPLSQKFRNGMSSRKDNLNDPPRDKLEEPFSSQSNENEIHVMILFAHDDLQQLESIVNEYKQKPGFKVLKVQYGQRLMERRQIIYPNQPPKEVVVDKEPFGFVDGISQPLFLESQITKFREQELGGTDKWDPSAPLKIILKPDRAGIEGQSYGSYLVFRKLKQYVSGFNQAVRQLAHELNISEEFAFAQTVGRFKDGTPLALTAQPQPEFVRPINNFNYQGDSHGLKCPLHAHIRKTNPRGSVPFISNEIRIARRGIPYNEKNGPDTEAKLKQFETIQQLWSNSTRFPPFHLRSAGRDPIIGQAPNQNEGVGQGQYWVATWGQEPKKRFHFGQYVQLKGGEYFFAPSLSGLRALCGASEISTAVKNNIKSDITSNEPLPTETTENRTQNTNVSQNNQKQPSKSNTALSSTPKSKSQSQKRTPSKGKSK